MRTQTMGKAFDSFPLGKSPRCLVSMDCGKTQLNNNILVVGGTGSGKTYSVLYPMFLHLQYGNAVGVFTKHSKEQAQLMKLLRQRGYTIHILDFSNPQKSSFSYDPLIYCQNNNDINDLVKSIAEYDGGHGTSDRYWTDTARGLLCSVLRYVKNGYYSGGTNLAAALKLLDTLPLTTWENALDEEYLPEKEELLYHEIFNLFNHDSQAKTFWLANIFHNADNTRACVISSAQALLENLFTVSVRRMISGKKNFDFSNLLKPKQVLFIYTSPVNQAMDQLVGLFYRQFFQQLFNLAEEQCNKKLPYPVYVLCDDFSTGARIDGFPKLISIFREKGIAVTLLIQSESQLSSLYGEADATTIINNCDHYIYLGGMDLTTCRDISIRLNRPCSEILSMPLGREYFFCRGQVPVKTERYDFFSDKIYLAIQEQEERENLQYMQETLELARLKF